MNEANEKEKNIVEQILEVIEELRPFINMDGGDILHQVLEHDADDDSLLKYIDLVNDYEDFLRNVYDLFKTKSSMLKIEWLISKS